MGEPQYQKREFFTIGYGGRSPTEFISLLKSQGVRTLVDVRLRPDRARLGCYVRAKSADKGIEKLLAGEGVRYLSLIELGNIFRDRESWREPYRRLLDAAGDLLTAKLNDLDGPLCLMCAEKDVNRCHRQLISAYLERSDWLATHL